MTIIDAITQADETNKNGYSMLQKITWLSRVEAMVKKEVIDTHDGGCGIRFSGFDESTPPDTPADAKHSIQVILILYNSNNSMTSLPYKLTQLARNSSCWMSILMS